VLLIAALACCLAALAGCGNPGESADDSSAPKDTKIDPASFKGKTLTSTSPTGPTSRRRDR
jgi:hypothetical protein